MAAATDLSYSSSSDRTLEQNCSPSLSRELLCEVLRSLHTLAGQLKLRDDVVKITIDWNKLQNLSAFQPAVLFSALEQHILFLQIDRRISAFIERKQAEINENNVREFCNVIDCNQENSCARTDAVFTPYPGFKSHVKENSCARTDAAFTSYPGFKSHVKGGPVPRDIYQRIKKLEDKILELEGISPEYFQSVNFSGKRRKVQPPQQNYSLAELDEKISALRQALLRKSREADSMATHHLP